MNQKPFIIYKSSAGSGKTYTLTLEYLKLALQNPRSGFKQILAVTFTNKATAEMKERILEVLERLSHGVKQGEFLDEELMKHLKLDEKQLQSRARETLLSILHGYGYFSVSTIDSFFQKVIRSFAREMDLQAKFDLEMDTDAVLERLVDRIVEKVAQDKNLRAWLIGYAEEQIEDGKTWDIRNGIKGLGREIFQERFKAFRSLFQESVAQEGFLGEFRKQLQSERRKLIAEAEEMKANAESIRVQFGLVWTDFKGGSRSFALRFSRLGDPKFPFPELTEVMLRDLPDANNWFSKGAKNAANIISAAEGGLIDILFYWPEKVLHWNTLSALQRNLNAFGVFRDLILELRDLKDEESILLISDVNDFLKQITEGNEAPFIYEKIGNQYRHFLIDEFQDTSDFQWSSFRPLLENSLASGNTNLLVGDVKQSIYRWRGGKLELLLNEVQRQIREDLIDVKNLDTNFRSLPGIIEFNNALFEQLPSLMQSGMQDYFAVDAQNLLNDAFLEVAQKVPQKKKDLEFQGKIHLEFTEKSNSRSSSEEEETEEDEPDQTVLAKLPGLVMQLQDQGYGLSDIAFLVRKNAQGAEIADYLMNYHRENPDSGYRFDVLSEESLFIDKSIAVKCLLAFFTYLNNPSDKVALKTLWNYYALLHEVELSHSLFYQHSLPDALKEKEAQLLSMENRLLQLPLVELMEEGLAFLGLTEKQQDLAYVSGFKEAVFDFVKKNRADLMGFLDWWELNKGKRTVKISEDHDAMRILTIHKSKGLQYKVVIMPFLDWGIVASGQQAPVIWAPYQLGNLETVIPLTHQKDLKNSHFSDYYQDEVRLAYLDSLNMLYVAFTRAEEVIWGFSDFTRSKEGVKLNQTGNVLYTLFSTGFHIPDPSDQGWNSELMTFDWGEWGRKIPPKDQKPKVPLGLRWEILDWKEKLKTRNYAWDFSEDGLQARNQRKLGVIIHELLADSQRLEDALRLLREFTFEGRWDGSTASEVKVQLEMFFGLNQIQDWFGPAYQSLSEQGILLPGGAQKRPDRILIGKDQALVIDFKTGEKRESHLNQVKEYMDLVAKLSQLPVKGYLCYLEPTEILEV